MAKSNENGYLELYRAVLLDCSAAYPSDAGEFSRDLLRLTHLYNTRGSKVFTLDLPVLAKRLDAALSHGVLDLSNCPFVGRKKGSSVPRLFQALWRRVFASDRLLEENLLDITAVVLLRQLLHCCRKAKEVCDDSKTYKAVSEYYHIESILPSPNLLWATDDEFVPTRSVHLTDGLRSVDELPFSDTPGDDQFPWGVERDRPLLDTIQRTADFVIGSFQRFDPLEDIAVGKHGPGVVSDGRRDSFKYEFPHWPKKLELLLPYDWHGVPNPSFVMDSEDSRPGWAEHPCRLIAVPKTVKTPRLIASEPTAHQWCQHLVADWLVSQIRCSRLGLGLSAEFRDQRPNQEMAVRASISGESATIDLSSASDRLSCWLVERLFRGHEDLLYALHATRTRWIVNNVDKKLPRYHMFRKFSSMGSALTFPVQTLVFLVVTMGCVLHGRGLRPTTRNIRALAGKVRVFGDDIICPTEEVSVVMHGLRLCGLKVNVDKTFRDGLFRESCGVDAFRGVEVTPTYVSRVSSEFTPESLAANVTISNNLHRAGLWNTASWLQSTLPGWFQRNMPVLHVDSGNLGFQSFVGPDFTGLRNRWNEDLQCWMLRVSTVKVRSKRRYQGGIGSLLQYFAEKPDPDIIWASGAESRPSSQVAMAWVPLSDLLM